MPLTNYRDLSTSASEVNAGFQFEFACELTGRTWKSPFRPYRKGRVFGWMSRAANVFYQLYDVNRAAGYAAEAGMRSARAEALAEAQEMALQHFRQCETCRKWVCLAAWDEDSSQCTQCAGLSRGSGARSAGAGGYGAGYREDDSAAEAAGPVCPNCQTPSQGGRFCHECGFDMASTHKSCPSCGTTLARQARFCTDCGHAF